MASFAPYYLRGRVLAWLGWKIARPMGKLLMNISGPGNNATRKLDGIGELGGGGRLPFLPPLPTTPVLPGGK